MKMRKRRKKPKTNNFTGSQSGRGFGRYCGDCLGTGRKQTKI